MFKDFNNNPLESFDELINKFECIGNLPIALRPERANQLFLEISIKIEGELRVLSSTSSSSSPSIASRKRIEAYKQAKTKYLKKCKDLLGNKYIEFKQDKIPKSNFNLYPELFLRDWAWESSDLDSFFNYLKNINEQNILFLGCGAGRLAFEVATFYKDKNIFASDLNPLNLLPIFQKNYKIYDAQLYPKSLDDVSQKYNIKPIQIPDNLKYFVSDFYDLPIETCECVITTWLLDTLPNKFHELISHVINYISEEGTYYYIGLSNFHKKSLEDSLCQDEIIEVFNNYFNEVTYESKFIPYLQDPKTATKREELVFICYL
jgi:hypothetical protein